MADSRTLPRIVLLGAAGRMGRTIASRFLSDGKVELVGACDVEGAGSPVGLLAGAQAKGPTIVESVTDLPGDLVADIALDFSTPSGTRANIRHCLEQGWDCLIGVTGFAPEDIVNFTDLADKHHRRIILVPNFTLGVNLMIRFARVAGKVFKGIEIIEMHHDGKADAPSGTALHTAHLIASDRAEHAPPGPDDKSRGRIEDGIPIHAVRLPGLLAHQEVLFGSQGEVLTIRHDTMDRSAFLSGIYLAIEKMPGLAPGFVNGLDWAFELREEE